jgi:hypothetical protein
MKRSLYVVAISLAATGCTKTSPTEPAEDPFTDGLLVFMPFDNGAADESGNGNNGTLLGGASASNGSLAIGGNNLRAMSLPSSILNGRVDFTVAAFLRLQSPGAQTPHLISGANASEDNAFVVAYRESASEWLLGIDTHSNPDGVFAQDSTIEDGGLHHVAVTREGNSARLYIDGVPLGSPVAVVASALEIDFGGLIVGQDQDLVGGGFETDTDWPGFVDNLRIYDRALGPAAIALLATETN